jgi:hypothetical protein
MNTNMSVLASWTDTNRPAAWGTPNIGTFTSQLLAAGSVLKAVFLPSQANYYFGAFRVSFIHT